MRTDMTNTSVLVDSLPSVTSRKVEWGPLVTPFIILALCLLPVRGETLNAGKLIVGIVLFLLTLPAVLAALVNKVKVSGRKILLAFLFANMLNIFVALAYHLSLSRWFRLAFGTYIFVAMIFLVAYKANTSTRRHHFWMLLVVFLSFASYFDYFMLAKLGLAEAFNERVAGWHPGPMVAVMMLFPVLGNLMANKKWLLLFFLTNLGLNFLSASRGIYLVVAAGASYTFIFVQKQLSYRLLFLFLVMIVGIIFVVTPVYERMGKRYSAAASGQDNSLLGRFDEAKSAFRDTAKTWPTLFFGKGFGARYKVDYELAGDAKAAQLPGGYNIDGAHNDYATRFLYSGFIGLALQLLMYLIIIYRLVAAIRLSKIIDTDIYTKVRLHGALLVLFSMIMQGFAGGVFFFFTNNIYQACAIGLGLADAEAVLARKVTPPYQAHQPQSQYRDMPARVNNEVLKKPISGAS